jgi:hypothetical protein
MNFRRFPIDLPMASQRCLLFKQAAVGSKKSGSSTKKAAGLISLPLGFSNLNYLTASWPELSFW